MNQIRILAFAGAKEAMGGGEWLLEVVDGETAAGLMARCFSGVKYDGWRVAFDLEYGDWGRDLSGVQEMALIPPVSGG